MKRLTQLLFAAGFFTLGVALTLQVYLALIAPLADDDFFNTIHARTEALTQFVIHTRYRSWTGNVVPSLVIWAELNGPRSIRWSGLANGLGWLALWLGTIILVLGRKPRAKLSNLWISILVLGTLWFGLPAVGQTVFNRTAAGEYMWSLLAAMPLIYWFACRFDHDTGTRFQCAVLFLAGLLAGLAKEQLGLILCVFAATQIALRMRRGLQIPRRALWALAGVAVGFIVVILAPGNRVRMAAMPARYTSFGFLLRFAGYIANAYVLNLLNSLGPWLALIVLSGALGRSSKFEAGPQQVARDLNIRSALLAAAVGAGLLFMLPDAAPVRSAFFPTYFLILALAWRALGVDDEMAERAERWRVPLLVLSILLSAGIAFDSASGVLTSVAANQEQRRLAGLLQEDPAGTAEQKCVPAHHAVLMNNLTADSNFWVNQGYATAFGLPRVSVTGSGPECPDANTLMLRWLGEAYKSLVPMRTSAGQN